MIINGDCEHILPQLIAEYKDSNIILVSDPPYNMDYHYNTYDDNLPEDEYFSWMARIFSQAPSVIIHYPESLYHISGVMGIYPSRVISWVYNSNTPKQHRDVAFFGVNPNLKKVTQPYKNPNDKRIKKRIDAGILGGKLYDWWNINQVKNVSTEKTGHPCQIPIDVMLNIIGVLPEDSLIIDPFAGSGTTGVACKIMNRKFIGIEIDEEYSQLSRDRISTFNQKILDVL